MSIYITQGKPILSQEEKGHEKEVMATYKDILARVKYWESKLGAVEDSLDDLKESLLRQGLKKEEMPLKSVKYRELYNKYLTLGKMLFLSKSIKAKMEGNYHDPKKSDLNTFH